MSNRTYTILSYLAAFAIVGCPFVFIYIFGGK